MGLALAHGGFDVGFTAEDSQQVQHTLKFCCTPLSSRCVRTHGGCCRVPAHVACTRSSPTQADSDTETKDSRRSIVDVPEFDLTCEVGFEGRIPRCPGRSIAGSTQDVSFDKGQL